MAIEGNRQNRRTFLKTALATLGGLYAIKMPWPIQVQAAGEIERIMKSDEQWQKELTEKQYDVLREEATERPFTSPLLDEKRTGTYVCAGCGLPLFESSTKYNSGTGWPSFYKAIDGHVETKTDYKIVVPRTEYHCARCGGHQGHVFEDGPDPTGLRYCNNGVSLKFVPGNKE